MKETKSLAYKLFIDTQQDNLEYIYRGEFNIDITDNILSLAEESLKMSEQKLKIKKRVYFVMVEGLQNITRHQDLTTDDIPVKPGFFVLQRKKYSYYITTGNLIHRSNIELLQSQIETVQRLNREELNEYYKQHLDGGKLSEKGGAGLGLIEMARKSKGKLSYNFRKINDDYYYFYLLTEIPFEEKPEGEIVNVNHSLDNIIELHNILNVENIVLNYSGMFNQHSLVDLLGIIEKQMKDTVLLKSKTYNIMVELLQNLVKHSAYYVINGIGGHYGIFYIVENADHFLLNTGNFVQSKNVSKLKIHLDKVNVFNDKQLNQWYDEMLLDPDSGSDNTSTGLGLIDLKLRSQHNLDYSFIKIDEDFHFFSVKVKVNKFFKRQESFISKESFDRPAIRLIPSENLFLFKGRSIPSNAEEFYKPVLNWLDTYFEKPNNLTVFEFKFEHINTASSHQIFKILKKIKDNCSKYHILIKWHYKEEDEDMLATAVRFRELLDLKMDLKVLND